MHPLLRKINVGLVILLAISTTAAAFQMDTGTVSGFTADWNTWATTAWKYFLPTSQDTWNQNTGLTSDSYNWHYFTLWGLASNIFGIIAADRLNLNMGACTNCPFTARVGLILHFLEQSSIRHGTTLWLLYYSDTGQPFPNIPPDTNAADYGRFLLSAFILLRYLTQKSLATPPCTPCGILATRLQDDVNSLNALSGIANMYTTLGTGLYPYYSGMGFKLWGFNVAYVEDALLNHIANGPFVDPSQMYGVSGIPSTIGITSELQVNAILELNGIPLVTSTQAWTAFYGLASKIYLVQQDRYLQTGILTAWSEGALGLPNGGLWGPGFVYEAINDPSVSPSTWVIRDTSNKVLWSQANGPSPDTVCSAQPCHNEYLPVTFSKIAFGFLSLYGATPYLQTLVNTVVTKSANYNTYGYAEGLSEVPGGPMDGTWNVQTQDTILTAAAYQTLPLFQMSISPTNPQIIASQSESFSISVTFAPSYLFTTTLSLLSTPSLPSDASYNFNPATITPSGGGTGSSTLTINTVAKTGTFNLIIQLSDLNPTSPNNGLTSVVTDTLTIVAPTVPDFAISVNPATVTVVPGNSGQFNVPVQFLLGFSSAVTLSVTPTISGVTPSFNPNPVPGGVDRTSVLTMTTTTGAATGTYTLTITGTAGSLVHSVTATFVILTPDFAISVNPATVTVVPGNSGQFNVPVQFLLGFSSAVTLSVTPTISGVTPSFNPNPVPGGVNSTSVLTMTTTTAAKSGTYTLTITGTAGSLVHSVTATLALRPSVSGLGSILLNAPAPNTVYFIFPDSDTSHPKPTQLLGVGYSQVTDWTALGYVYGSLNNMPQVTALDTNTSYVDSSTGAPKIRNSVIVLFGGRLVNTLAAYYDKQGISPLYWVLTGGFGPTGVETYYTRSNVVAASMTVGTIGGGGQDMPLIEVFADPFGNTVVIFAGFGWKGTFASGLFFKTYLEGNLSGLTDSWYFWNWQDLNHNGFADWYEVNPTPANHGN